MKILKIIKLGFHILAFPILPILYIIFRKQIIKNWNSFESIIALFSYCLAVLSLYYNSNSKLFFIIRNVLCYIKHDYTTWRLAFRYENVHSEITIPKLKESILRSNFTIQQEQTDYLTTLWNQKVFITFRVEKQIHQNSILVYSSQFDVPFKTVKTLKKELASFFESFEEFINSKSKLEKRYEIAIKYHDGSPFYSYWVRNIPEQEISQFSAKINTPKLSCKNIKIEKTTIIVESTHFTELLEDVQQIISYQGL